MKSVQGYEERAYQFSKRVVLFIKRHEFRKADAVLINQVLRSSTSIGANIIEGKAGNSKRVLINYFSIALRSANETIYWLRLLSETCEVDQIELKLILKECDEIRRILAKSIIIMKKNMGV
jgi:four helix bundle protein